jgi:uncharacterized cupin superfamily protein
MQRAIHANSAAPRAKQTNYPRTVRDAHGWSTEAPLGELFGLRNFGINLTTLAPGGSSALFHGHSRQDEFIYMLEGDLVLVTDNGEQHLGQGTSALRPAGHNITSSTGPIRRQRTLR